jgi:hypothetical protein
MSFFSDLKRCNVIRRALSLRPHARLELPVAGEEDAAHE